MDQLAQDFHGFTASPFGPAAAGGPLFAAASTNALLDAILADLGAGQAIIAVRGEQGVGKTTLLRRLVPAVEAAGATVCCLPGATLTPSVLQRAIRRALALDEDRSHDPADLVVCLRERGGAGVVMFVDDADAMPAAPYHYLEHLLSLLVAHRTALQIVLLGRLGHWSGLSDPSLKALRWSIASQHVLFALTDDEARDYLDHKLQAAGVPLGRVATRAAVKALCDQAGCVPAQIDALAAAALEHGRHTGHRRITRRSLRGLGAPPDAKQRHPLASRAQVSVSVAVMAALATGAMVALSIPVATPAYSPGTPPTQQERTDPGAAVGWPGTTAQLPVPVMAAPAPPQEASVAPPSSQTADALDATPPEPLRGAAGLVLLAGAHDNMRSLYKQVYRGLIPPAYETVAGMNRLPVTPGALVVFPEPEGGWRTR